MEEGILVDYLDRKSREVRNMLCAQYSYKMDIAVKKEEAFKEGIAAGISQGEQKKAVEDAIMIINEFKTTPEFAAQKVNVPLELVLEALNKKK